MKFILFIVLLVIASINSLAQKPKEKDVTNLLYNAQHTTVDSLKINYYNRISRIYLSNNLDSSIYYGRKALTLSYQIKNKELLSDSKHVIGVSYLNMSKLDSAGSYLFSALELTTDKLKKTKIKITIGEYYRANAEWNKSANVLKQSIVEAIRSNNTNLLPQAFNRLGAVYFELSINNAVLNEIYRDSILKTIAFIDTSFLWSKKLNTKKFDLSNYTILGACYHKLKDYTKAIYYLEQALTLCKEENDLVDAPIIYRNLSSIYQDAKQYSKAKEMALLGAYLADSLKVYSSLAFNYYELVLIGQKTKDDYLALTYLSKRDSVEYLIKSETAISKAKEYEEKYKSKEKELIIQQKNLEIEKNEKRVMLFSVAFLFALILLISGILFSLRINKINKLLKVKNTEIEQAKIKLEKLGALKSDLMGMIAHDLKTPLNTIINLSELNNSPENKQANYNERIKTTSIELMNMINNIVDIKRMEESEIVLSFSIVSLNKLVETIIKDFETFTSSKNLQVNVNYKEILFCKVDESWIKRAISNIFTNAIKFTPNNGIIVFDLSVENGLCVLKISDNGPGISPDKIGHLFNKYSRSEIREFEYTGSAGLGLAFTKMAINAHAGKVDVISEFGKGACFRVYLPVESITNSINQDSIKSEIVFSSEFNSEIVELKKILLQYKFYETSELLNIIYNYQCNNKEFILWRQQIENSILNSNQKMFNDLLSS